MIIRSIITLVICILGMKAVKTRFETEEIRPVGWLLFVMPYFSGGFYSGGCAAATVFCWDIFFGLQGKTSILPSI